jgi:hypothetical protein
LKPHIRTSETKKSEAIITDAVKMKNIVLRRRRRRRRIMMIEDSHV